MLTRFSSIAKGLGIFVALAGLIALYVKFKPNESSQNIELGATQITSDVAGLSMPLPEDWKVSFHNTEAVALVGANGETTFTVVVLQETKEEAKETMEDFSKKFINQVKVQNPDLHDVSETDTQVYGHPAKVFEYASAAAQGGKKMAHTQVRLEDGVAISLICASTSAAFENAKKECAKLVESIKLL